MSAGTPERDINEEPYWAMDETFRVRFASPGVMPVRLILPNETFLEPGVSKPLSLYPDRVIELKVGPTE